MHFALVPFAHGTNVKTIYGSFYIWNMSAKADGCPARRAVEERTFPLLNYPNLKRRRNSPKGSKKRKNKKGEGLNYGIYNFYGTGKERAEKRVCGDCSVQLVTTIKNNGIVLNGITILQDGCNISAIVTLMICGDITSIWADTDILLTQRVRHHDISFPSSPVPHKASKIP